MERGIWSASAVAYGRKGAAHAWVSLRWPFMYAAKIADDWERQSALHDAFLRLEEEGQVATPKRDKATHERDEQHGQRLYQVAWWDDSGNRGHSEPMSEEEANRVRDAHRHEQHTRHAIKVEVNG